LSQNSKGCLQEIAPHFSIKVKITDVAGIPFGQMGSSIMGLMEFENEIKNGYEKSIQVKGFKGTEKIDRSEENKSAEI